MSDPIFGEAIYTYTREQAIADGVLIDVSAMAKEAGFKYPTVITSAVYEHLSDVEGKAGQSFDGRLWDVLFMLKARLSRPLISTERRENDRINFSVKVSGRLYDLYAVCGPGDTESLVLTIMEQGED